jgi:diguanylate cyclase (GGDEF)-like protein
VLFGCFSSISYGIVIYGLFINHPDQLDLRIEILQLIVLMAVLSWFSVVGGYISQLRQRINRTNSELSIALTKIEQLVEIDDLTGVYNRRKMLEILKREKALADRGGDGFAICLFDLDHFKQINDSFGHLAGDNVLQLLTKEVQKEIRASDSLARYGGEEFVVILSRTNLEGALEYAERIRIRVEKISHPNLGHKKNVTISIGVVGYTPSESLESLLSKADEALYVAKTNGRNRVEFYKGK